MNTPNKNIIYEQNIYNQNYNNLITNYNIFSIPSGGGIHNFPKNLYNVNNSNNQIKKIAIPNTSLGIPRYKSPILFQHQNIKNERLNSPIPKIKKPRNIDINTESQEEQIYPKNLKENSINNIYFIKHCKKKSNKIFIKKNKSIDIGIGNFLSPKKSKNIIFSNDSNINDRLSDIDYDINSNKSFN